MKLLVKIRRYIQAQEEYHNGKNDYWKYRRLEKGQVRQKPKFIEELQQEEAKHAILQKKKDIFSSLHRSSVFGLPDDDDDSFYEEHRKKEIEYSRVEKKIVETVVNSDNPIDPTIQMTNNSAQLVVSDSNSVNVVDEELERERDEENFYKNKVVTYSDIGYEAMGKTGSFLSYFFFLTCNMGVCTIYIGM